MAKQKMQRPLLYIQQPNFETIKAPMQQFFMTKKPKPLEENATLEKINKEERPEIMEPVRNEMEPNIMEFILEGILTPGLENEKIEEISVPRSSSLNAKKEEIHIINETFNDIIPRENGSTISETSKGNRAPFNESSLENKLKRIKKMTAMVVKFKYEFVTVDQTIVGYLLLAEENIFTIQPLNTDETIELNEESIIDIKIVGL